MPQKGTLTFIDVFAGCGGLSLGLFAAGCQGLFAIEKNPLAFATLEHNLIKGERYSFKWPEWLPRKAVTCEELLANYSVQLRALRGTVDLIVGGPPCQGFSTAGKRDPTDPRNKMTEQYLKLVSLVKPRFLAVENVAGFNMRFDSKEEGLRCLIGDDIEQSYAEYISRRLRYKGYKVFADLVNCAEFGVPQNRRRFLMICELLGSSEHVPDLMALLRAGRRRFLSRKGLPLDRPVNTKEAIGDLEVSGRLLQACPESRARKMQASYSPPSRPTAFQDVMRRNCPEVIPNSRRLAKHKPETIQYFTQVQTVCTPGRCLSKQERSTFGRRKHSTTVLDAEMPAPTVTTLPDDIIHYSEPRILTVREIARLQSFPDWFSFQGKYTTGGKGRKHDCPRYTQVGNAVPPLLSEAIGCLLKSRLGTRKQRKELQLSRTL